MRESLHHSFLGELVRPLCSQTALEREKRREREEVSLRLFKCSPHSRMSSDVKKVHMMESP